MSELDEFQFHDASEGNLLMKKYLALRNKCEQIQQGNEKLVNRLQHVKKLIKTYHRQKKFLQQRLDGFKDNYREAQVPVMWEEDHMYNLLKPQSGPGILPGLPMKEVPSTSTSKPKTAKKVKTLIKSHGVSSTNQLTASQSHEGVFPSASHQNEAFFARLGEMDTPPKRPANAFMMFCDQYKQSIQNDYMREKKTVISQAELTKRLTLKWNSLATDDKKIYYDMFEIGRRSAENEAASAAISQDADMYMDTGNLPIKHEPL